MFKKRKLRKSGAMFQHGARKVFHLFHFEELDVVVFISNVELYYNTLHFTVIL